MKIITMKIIILLLLVANIAYAQQTLKWDDSTWNTNFVALQYNSDNYYKADTIGWDKVDMSKVPKNAVKYRLIIDTTLFYKYDGTLLIHDSLRAIRCLLNIAGHFLECSQYINSRNN